MSGYAIMNAGSRTCGRVTFFSSEKSNQKFVRNKFSCNPWGKAQGCALQKRRPISFALRVPSRNHKYSGAAELANSICCAINSDILALYPNISGFTRLTQTGTLKRNI